MDRDQVAVKKQDFPGLVDNVVVDKSQALGHLPAVLKGTQGRKQDLLNTRLSLSLTTATELQVPSANMGLFPKGIRYKINMDL